MKTKQRKRIGYTAKAVERGNAEDKVQATAEELARLLMRIEQYEKKWGKL